MIQLNYEKLLRLQKELDESIKVAHDLEGDYYFTNKNIALLVEFSEFANEMQSFKYWKKHKNINEEALYEEFADVLHFMFSFSLDAKDFDIKKTYPNTGSVGLDDSMQQFYAIAANIYQDNKINNKNLYEAFSWLWAIVDQFELDVPKVEEYYIKKNKINHERIKNNY